MGLVLVLMLMLLQRLPRYSEQYRFNFRVDCGTNRENRIVQMLPRDKSTKIVQRKEDDEGARALAGQEGGLEVVSLITRGGRTRVYWRPSDAPSQSAKENPPK